MDAFVIAHCGSYHGRKRPLAGTTLTMLAAISMLFNRKWNHIHTSGRIVTLELSKKLALLSYT